MTVAMTATELTMRFRGYNVYSIDTIINISQVVFVTFSLFINFSATSIIARKAWCVPVSVSSKNISLTAP
jgi:hypothetical protein